MTELDSSDIEALKDCFDTFDFFNACRGTIDGTMVGDIMRCAKLNPTSAVVMANGGCEEKGEKQVTFEEIMPMRQEIVKQSPDGTFEDYMEVFRSFDRDYLGVVQLIELDFILTGLGEKLTREQYNEIFVDTEIKDDEDGCIQYEPFIKNLLKGYPEPPKED